MRAPAAAGYYHVCVEGAKMNRWSIPLLCLSLAFVIACGGSSNRVGVTPTPTPQRSGIEQLDRFLDAIRSRDASALQQAVTYVTQVCDSNPQPSPSGPLSCVSTPYDGGSSVDMSSVPVFTWTDCSRSFFTEAPQVNAAMDRFVAQHQQLSVYAVDRAGIGKFDDGYRVFVTDGETPSPTANASIWYLRPDGKIISVLDRCGGVGAAALIAGTAPLADPVIEPPP